ncbi:nucleoside-diphosphate sugar epimerase/dehydratase [Selenomonas sp. oral taxon 478]|uniref:nucleoside-diphosphate sugar epimerase/dehydratase n=1 Tax=Selenomonas sp. oral taxon 478 TaxID=712538 RepID=UPI00067A2CF4|nr:nucleoside-diphosphate sugar epimerase/dehydratase [Selenomonas sp. oral taxon 478]AKT53213.1 polysaccharide biosynthesis protein [Selenomonas sp. oral taxon 478]
MSSLEDIRNKIKLIILDAVILGVMPLFASLLRFDGVLPAYEATVLRVWMLPCIAFGIAVFYFFGMYHRMWRYARMRDLYAIVGAVTLAETGMFLLLFYAGENISKSIFPISWMLVLGGVGLSRLAFKINLNIGKEREQTYKNLLIVGAGDAGAMIAREIEQNDAAAVKIIGFVDDDAKKKNNRLAGVSILGGTDDIPELVQTHHIEMLIVAIPSAGGDKIRRITDICRRTSCAVRIMPGLYEMTDNVRMQPGMRRLRDIRLEDLLRREPIHLDFDKITHYIAGKTVLITGAGGSIGSELARQISRVGAKEILLLGRGENSIYEIYQELKVKFPAQSYRTIIANVTEKTRMEEVFQQYHPEVVFHAAAHKHVPLMEMQPEEAVHNNVFGTKNVAELADTYRSEIFVLISTDKAVNPTSVMGATKRAAELVLQEINQNSATKFVTVRFGNVLGSRGSVVPLFERQIAAGGPVTVTHPEMTRFFMTIPEAVQLVLQAGSQAEGGEVFLFDMGEPVKINDMACDLIRLHGLTPNKDVNIIYTGMRPGEKLYEELLTSEEGTTSTKHKKIYKARISPLNTETLRENLKILSHTQDQIIVIKTLQQMIPTYRSKQLEDIENQRRAI